MKDGICPKCEEPKCEEKEVPVSNGTPVDASVRVGVFSKASVAYDICTNYG